MKCKTCKHKWKGDFIVYCKPCKHLRSKRDNCEPIEPRSLRNMPHPRQEQDPDEPYYNKDGRV